MHQVRLETLQVVDAVITHHVANNWSGAFKMSKSKTTVPQKVIDHNSDIVNANAGTIGTNITYDKNAGNKGKQLNPNRKK